jgi:hypothetical protein
MSDVQTELLDVIVLRDFSDFKLATVKCHLRQREGQQGIDLWLYCPLLNGINAL